jgi:hypothetical protein
MFSFVQLPLTHNSDQITFIFIIRPREERLFELGWKDSSCFFGGSDAFMTSFFSMREKKIFQRTLNDLRGLAFEDAEEVAGSNDRDEKEAEPDIEDIIRWKAQVLEEDMFIPRTFEDPLASLPHILRKSAGCPLASLDDLDLERRKHATAHETYELLNYIIDDDSRVKASRPKLGWVPVHSLVPEDVFDRETFLDYLPLLRSMALSESVAEFLHNASKTEEEEEHNARSRRSTRSATRNGRQNYFDTISKVLKQDLADISTSDVTSRLAATRLQYAS